MHSLGVDRDEVKRHREFATPTTRARPLQRKLRRSGARSGVWRAPWRSATWNAGPLFQARPAQRRRRKGVWRKLLAAHDVVLVQECRASPTVFAAKVR